MSIEVKKISYNKLPLFIKFASSLYHDCDQWVPPIIKSEVALLDKNRNSVLKNIDIEYFLAYHKGQIIGRIAAIINWKEVEAQGKKKVRFGWFDFINDSNVCEALLNHVMEYGRRNKMEYMEGPVGISNLDKAGMLTSGFSLPGKLTTYYNHSYYPKIMKKLGYTVAENWVEYGIEVPNETNRIHNVADLIKKRLKLKSHKLKSSKQILSYTSQMIDLLNLSFKKLSTYTPIEGYQSEHYAKKYAKFIHPDFVSFIFDEDDNMIAFGITLPNLSKTLRKINGHLFPFGVFRIAKAFKKTDVADLNFIGVHPDYQNKGVTAVIFSEILRGFEKKGVKRVEVGPGLQQNEKFHALWKRYNPQITRTRCTFRKDL